LIYELLKAKDLRGDVEVLGEGHEESRRKITLRGTKEKFDACKVVDFLSPFCLSGGR
jgi:hypothetical protein